MNALNFQECSSCAAKSGSPTLCESCVHNRAALAALDARWRYAEELIDQQRNWAKRECRKAFIAGVVLGLVPLAVVIGLQLP